MNPIPLGSIPSHYAEILGPSRPALTYPDGVLSWSELDRQANQMAHMFADLGVAQDHLVTLALPNTTRFHVATFALWKLGATPHVVSPRLPPAELRAIADLAKPRLVVGVDSAILPDHRTVPPDLSCQCYPETAVQVRVAKYWKAMSSGGSTGRPKIIVDHNPAATLPFEWTLDLPRHDCVLNPGPLYHNGPFVVTNYALARGNHIVGMAKFDALECLGLIERYRVSWVMMVPTMMHRIWRLPEAERQAFNLSSLAVVGHVAAPMPIWLKEEWIAWLGAERVFELYGGTEATGATWISGTEWLAHKGSVGKFIRDSKVKILDEHGAECPPGVIGEVFLMPANGPGSTYHYIGAAAKSTPDGWESLGDMGWLDDDGYLYLADRGTDLIISGGANIYPAEVEAALSAHPGVDTAVAIGLPDPDMGELVHAIVCPRDEWNGRLDEAALRAVVEQQLARYKTPRTYEFVNYSLRDDAGKVRRSQLRQERIGAGPGG